MTTECPPSVPAASNSTNRNLSQTQPNITQFYINQGHADRKYAIVVVGVCVHVCVCVCVCVRVCVHESGEKGVRGREREREGGGGEEMGFEF